MSGHAKRSTPSPEWEFTTEKSLLQQERRRLLRDHRNLSFNRGDGFSQSCLQRILQTKGNIGGYQTFQSQVQSWLPALVTQYHRKEFPHTVSNGLCCLGNTTSFLSYLGFSYCFSDSKVFSYCFYDSNYSPIHWVGINIALPGFKYHFKPTFFQKKILYLFSRPHEFDPS